MTTQIKTATIDDIPHLANFLISAGGGYIEVLYDGLESGHSLESLIQPQFTQANTTPFYENHLLAINDGQIAGGMHAFAWEDVENFPLDPLVPQSRHDVAGEYLTCMPAPDTYYIHVLAVYPEFRGKGVAGALISNGLKHADNEGFAKCSLYVMAGNIPAIELYKKRGFEVVNHYLIPQHRLLYYPGEMLLMTCAVGA